MKHINYTVRIGCNHLPPDHVLRIDNKLTDFLSVQQPFLRQSYTLRQLSEDTQIPLHHLSALINQHYGVRFNDFINHYRVNHCKLKIINEEWKQKTLETIAEESGFSNRNTFAAAFKKITGVNPSGYLKYIKEGHAG